MKKTKIQSIEEAVSVYEESSIIRGTATMNGDAKTNNKYVPVQNRALVYLYEHDSLAALHPLLSHSNFNVRLYAAYALLPLFEDECRKELLEIANGDSRIYEIQGFDAKMILMMWDIGELRYPYQPDYGKKPSEESNKKIEEAFLSNRPHLTVEKAEKKGFSPEILRLSRLFGCPSTGFRSFIHRVILRLFQLFGYSPTGANHLHNEQVGFYVSFDPEKQEIEIRVNTFVNPYTQDVKTVYQERVERFKAFEQVATIEANKPSKLGFMQIVLTIPKEKATDDVLIKIKDVIYTIFNEWKPNESLVWFKVNYHKGISYFEGSWWYPRRAIIKNRRGYERYDFSDEMKFDEEMWEIVQDEFDEFENSDSFVLIDGKVFQEMWEATELNYKPKPY